MVTYAWARRKEWIVKNPEKYREQKRAQYLKAREKTREKNKAMGAQRVEANRAYYRKYPEKLKERWLKSAYRMSLAEYKERLAIQNGRCAICSIPHEEVLHKKLQVDHCHRSGKNRGLLCPHCNKMIGLAKDRPEVLKAAAEYLIRIELDGKH